MPDLPISGLSSADPASTALVPVVVNTTTSKTTLDEAVGFWSTAAGDMVYAAAARQMARLAAPTSGAVLTYSSGTNAPAWSKPTSGAVLVASSLGVPVWRAIGTSGQVLESTGGTPTWTTPSAGANDQLTLVRFAANFALSSAATTGLTTGMQWDLEQIDEGNWHSTVSNSSRITPTSTGLYEIGFQVLQGASGNGGSLGRAATIYLNDTLPIGSFPLTDAPVAAQGWTGHVTHQTTAATDYFTVSLYFNVVHAPSPQINSTASRFYVRGPL